ncbi:MAG: hypothetical protein OSA97_17805, partial [Nevskia sp.]|nr:hypothetical protein [Nevskia sp.]
MQQQNSAVRGGVSPSKPHSKTNAAGAAMRRLRVDQVIDGASPNQEWDLPGLAINEATGALTILDDEIVRVTASSVGWPDHWRQL